MQFAVELLCLPAMPQRAFSVLTGFVIEPCDLLYARVIVTSSSSFENPVLGCCGGRFDVDSEPESL